MENIPNACLVLCLKQFYHSEVMKWVFCKSSIVNLQLPQLLIPQITKVMIYLYNMVGNLRFYKLFPKSLQNDNMTARMQHFTESCCLVLLLIKEQKTEKEYVDRISGKIRKYRKLQLTSRFLCWLIQHGHILVGNVLGEFDCYFFPPNIHNRMPF